MLLGDKKCSIDQLFELDKTLPSVPPVEGYSPIMGKLTMLIKMDYINLPFEKMFEFRYALWGSVEKLYFLSNKSQLKITASLQLLSKYFWDMSILCVEVISAMDSLQQDPNIIMTHRRSSAKSSHPGRSSTVQKKVVGYIYIPLRKYFINQIMNSFSFQKYPIIDLHKKRIGQVGVDLKIEMLENNGVKFKQIVVNGNGNKNHFHPIIHSPQRTQTKYLTVNYYQKPQASIMDRQSVANRFSYDEHETFQRLKAKKVTISDRPQLLSVYNSNSVSQLKDSIKQSRQNDKSLVDEEYSKKNYFSHSDLNEMESGKMVINQASEFEENIKSKRDRQSFNTNKSKRKSSFSKSHLHENIQQAKHTDLSLIQMKWGSNHPTVQLMKLRLDQAKYLQNISRNSTIDSENLSKQNMRLNLLLKDFVSLSARNFSQTRTLSISHISKNSKVNLKTEINLQALLKNPAQQSSVQLNHIIVLNGIQLLTDKILIETVDSFIQITMKDLLNNYVLDLRRRDNRKRAFQLRYQINFDNKELSSEWQKQSNNISPAKVQKKQSGIKTKQINKIINEGDNKRNKPPTNNLQIIPEKQNGEMAQQEIISPYNKLFSKNKVNNRKQQQRSHIDKEKCLISAFRYFELLYISEDEGCFQIVTKLLVMNQQNQLLSQQQILEMGRLESLFVNDGKQIDSTLSIYYSLMIVVNNLFRKSFTEFYKCFLSYKDINQKYQTVLYKLKKVLVSPSQDSKPLKREHSHLNKIVGILDYVKKHKKDKITFGLIKYEDLFHIIQDKLQSVNQQQIAFNSKLSNQKKKILTQKSEIVVQKQNQDILNHSNKESNHISQFISALLTMFTRYEKDYIKISEIQTNLEEFIKSRTNLQRQKREIFELNLNLGFLLNLHRQVEWKYEQKSHQKYTDSYLYHFIQENKGLTALHLNQRQEQHLDKMSVYDMLFSDPLNLQDLKSSIHYTLFDHQLQTKDYQFITEQQDVHNQRFKTLSQKANYSKIQPSQQFIPNHQPLKTSQVMKSQRNRLNTEDQRVIDFMNLKREVQQHNKINEGQSMSEERQHIHHQNDQVVGIQITKKEQFLQIQVQNQQEKLQNQQQNHKVENDSLLHQHQKVHDKAQTKYISVKCSLTNLQKVSRNSKILDDDKPQVVNLFYCHSKNDGQQQEFKIQARQSVNIGKIVPNSFIHIDSETTPVQEYMFRIQQHFIKTKRAQLAKREIEVILKVKNIIGKQSYPIEDSQGKICSIINIQIEEVDEFDQRRFQQKQQKILQSQKQKGRQKDSQKFNQLLILNVNRLYCLNLFEVSSCLRIIYETQNQIQILKDIDLFNSKDQSNKDLQMIKTGTRVLPINADFIKLNGQKRGLTQQKHFIKVFNVKKTQINKTTNNQNKTQFNKSTQINNKLKSRTSQPVNRFLIEDQGQNVSLDMKNVRLDLICQFQFTLNPNMPMQKSFGIKRQSLWLTDGPYRLQIDLFNTRYEKWSEQNGHQISRNQLNNEKINAWQKKIEKILTVFKIYNQQKVQKRFQQYKKDNHQNQITLDELMQLISSVMGYRLTEKQIFANLCFPSIDQQELSNQQKFIQMCSLFNMNEIVSKVMAESLKIKHLSALYEQFQTFDLEHEGFLSLVKFEVIKKILPQLNLLPTQRFILYSSKSQQKQLIRDCKVSQRQSRKSVIDYLKILWECRKNYEQDFFFENLGLNNILPKYNEQNVNIVKKDEVQVKKKPDGNKSLPPYYRISIKSFKNLRLNGIPCTLQFKINNKQLFEPIYRCYSHQFSQLHHISTVRTQQSIPQTYTLEVFNRLVSLQSKKERQDIYEYKLIEKFDLRKLLIESYQKMINQTRIAFELNCQNLDGTILIEIQCLQSKDQYEYCIKEQAIKQNDVDFQIEDNEQVDRRPEIQPNIKPTINPHLKKQFYEEQQSQIEQLYYQRKILKGRRQQKFIDESGMKAFNGSSSKKDKYNFQEKLRLERDESLLTQTRKEWQSMLYKNVEQNEIDEQKEDDGHFKADRLQSVLKKEINKQEINKKFELFKDDGFSNSSESQIEDY